MYLLSDPLERNLNSIISAALVLFLINGFLLQLIALSDTMINTAQIKDTWNSKSIDFWFILGVIQSRNLKQVHKFDHLTITYTIQNFNPGAIKSTILLLQNLLENLLSLLIMSNLYVYHHLYHQL